MISPACHQSTDDEYWSSVLQEIDGAAPCTTSCVAADCDSDLNFIDAPAFEKFGEWVEPISVARQGTMWRLARWLAIHRGESDDARALWRRCQLENPAWFSTYRIARLRKSSFFLPAGEVVFEVLENPAQIPDRPPRGVLMRHWEALTSAPEATYFFLRPVFATTPNFRLCTADELRREADGDFDEALFTAKLWGGAYRTADAMRRAAVAAGQLVERAARGAEVVLTHLYFTWLHWRARRRSQDLLSRIRQLDADKFLARTEGLKLGEAVHRVREQLIVERARRTFDPIHCFEVPHRPGELWFEAHWYEGCDGRIYVSY